MDSGEKDKEPVDADGEEVEASEPSEVTLAREEVNLLLTEQQKTAALKVRERDAALNHRNGLLSEPGNSLRHCPGLR